MPVQYYPSPDDQNWNREIEKLLPYVDGSGIDIGAGGRTINKFIVRCDIDKQWEPDVLCDGVKLSYKDNEFDFLVSVHSFEHFEDQKSVLKEWLRVIRKKGYILIVHPDVTYTHYQKGVSDNPTLAKNKYYKHFHERTEDQFLAFVKPLKRLGFEIVEHGVALGKWSFYFILRKT